MARRVCDPERTGYVAHVYPHGDGWRWHVTEPPAPDWVRRGFNYSKARASRAATKAARELHRQREAEKRREREQGSETFEVWSA